MSDISSILTKEEKEFIKGKNLNLSEFYDGRGQTRKEYHDNAKERDCYFVIGNPCLYGHRLRTRGGDCIICNPFSITCQKRESGKGVVYVAKCGRYSKVGMIENNIESLTTAIEKREYRLNSEGGYGDMTGWKIVKSWPLTKKAGKVEREAQQILKEYKVIKDYWYSNELRTTNELFLCSLNKAEEAVLTALEKNTISN